MKYRTQWNSATDLLDYLNKTYFTLHKRYEDYFWLTYMGDKSYEIKKDVAQSERENFRTTKELSDAIKLWFVKTNGITKERLGYWIEFFSRYQTPENVKNLRNEITKLETKIENIRSSIKEGYIDPKTRKFIKMSRNGMRSLMSTHNDEAIRKACFNALEKISLACVDEYVVLVKKRNEFAKALGYTDFYAYKLAVEEKMTKRELFSLFDEIYQKTKYAFKNIRLVEKDKPGLRKPWNFSYMMSSSFVKEADPYFPFEDAVRWWIETFSRLGISFRDSSLVLDLLDRKGKYNNGFCHWPEPVRYENNTRISGRSQFTCTAVLGIPGQSFSALHTLFHEGGHAAHLLNADNKDVCLNTEYPPASTAWDETQSMFLDSICSSIEWRTRYSKNAKGESYPLDLFKRQTKALYPLRPLGMMSIIMVTNFEKEIYNFKNITKTNVLTTAKKAYKKYTDRSVDSLWLLDVPHIYSWESACSYHGYGLATLSLSQWREYFFKKYGYIVDNANVGKEMQKVWKFGSKYLFKDMVKMATGKELSPKAYINGATLSLSKIYKTAEQRIARLVKVKQKPINDKQLNATISFVHGKQKIADSRQGFKKMTKKYASWLKTQYQKS